MTRWHVPTRRYTGPRAMAATGWNWQAEALHAVDPRHAWMLLPIGSRRVAACAIAPNENAAPVPTDADHAADPGHRPLSLAAWAGAAAAAVECGDRRQWQWQVQPVPRAAPAGGDRTGRRRGRAGPRRWAGFGAVGGPGKNRPSG